jgi:hypothetical protein
MTEPEAVFVVGAARSGTTLMRNLIERSDRIAIARENHFLGHLFGFSGARHTFRRAGDLASDDTMRRIVEMIYSGEFQGRSRWREVSLFWRWLAQNVGREDMEQRLIALPREERNERGLFAAFLRAYADKLGRPIIGEKTPAHLAHVDTLLEWFPNGRIVHMVRDPRAVYVSDLRRRRGKPRRPYSWLAKVPFMFQAALLIQTVIVWRGAARSHALLARRYPERYLMVRFEDLLREPEDSLSRLFEFIGVPLPPDPTDVAVYARGYRAGVKGLDHAAADRWRSQIHPLAARILTTALGSSMRRMGYGTDAQPPTAKA